MTFADAPTMPNKAPATLWIGSQSTPEFSAARAILRANGCLHDLAVVERDGSASPWAPQRGVVAASYPGEFSLGDWHRWQSRYPACQWVMLCGPWCRGQTRLPASVVRLDWHEFPSWWSRQVHSGADVSAAPPLVAGLVTAHVTQSGLYDSALRAAGVESVWVDPSVLPQPRGRCDFYVWDAAAHARCRPLAWRAMQRLAAHQPIVVVAPALRPDDEARWPGAAAYLSNPFDHEVLILEVRRIMASLGPVSSLEQWKRAG